MARRSQEPFRYALVLLCVCFFSTGAFAADLVAESLEDAGQLFGGAQYGSDPLMGTTLVVADADDAVRLNHSASIAAVADDYAIAFWYKPTQSFTGAWRSVVFKGDTSAERNFAIYLHPGSNRVHYRLSTDTSFNDGGNSNAELVIGEWHHLAYVRAGNRLSLYINGRLDSADTLASTPLVNDGQMFIGDSPYNPPALGEFAEVNVYQRTLSQLEVRSLYKNKYSDDNIEEQGVAIGTPAFANDGQYDGRALVINSVDDGVRIPNSILTRPGTADWGMAFWVRLDGAPSASFETLIHKGAQSMDRNVAIFRRPNSNKLHYAITLDNNPNATADSSADLVVGEWTHIALAKNGDRLQLFINGSLDSTLNFNGGQPAYNDGPLYVGKSPWYTPALATFDDLTLFNFRLIASDVQRYMARVRGVSRATAGEWGEVIPWPQVPVSMANLPDGRILTWSGSERTTWPTTEQSFSSVWDPQTNEFDDLFQQGHNMFCAHLAMAEDGQVFVNGGRNQTNSPWTSLFDYRDNQWTQVQNMATGGRWYPVTNALPNGEIITSMGTATNFRNPEKWSASSGWQVLNGVDYVDMRQGFDGTTGQNRWWPILTVAPNGKLFHYWSAAENHYIDTSGVGAVTPANADVDVDQPTGVAVQFDAGKVLMTGRNQGARSGGSFRRAYTIDLNGAAPVVRQTQEMQIARAFHNLVPLPNGEVIALGGSTYSGAFNNRGSVFQAEVWNPDSGTWRLLARGDVTRTYHSTGALLVDGRVLSAGGGYGAGNEFIDGSSHQNGQVFSPPYLFNADGTPAARPAITSAPGVVRAGVSFNVQASSETTRFSMLRMGANTHAVNTDSRFLWLDAQNNGNGAFTLTPDANPNVLLPGYWMVFALNANDVPSVAHIVRVERGINVSTPGSIRYLKLIANSEVNNNSWTSVAELNVLDGNGELIDRANWQVSADSAETGAPPHNAIDGNNGTIWHTVWAPPGQDNDPKHPHEIMIDLGAGYAVTALNYLPRQVGANGRIKDYMLQISEDGGNWDTVVSGSFANDPLEKSLPIGADADSLMVVPVIAGQSGSTQTFSVTGDIGLEYRFSFGDGSQSAWGTATQVSHTYSQPGRFVVVVTARNPATGQEIQRSFAHIVYNSAIDVANPNRWLSSTSVAYHPTLDQVWNVNPDNDSVTVIDSQTFAKIAEINVGQHPTTLAFDGAGRGWVVNRDSGSISVIDAGTLSAVQTVQLPNARSAPYGILMPSSAANSAVVSLEATDELIKLDTSTFAVTGSVATVDSPRHLAQNPTTNQLIAASFITPNVANESTAQPVVAEGTRAVHTINIASMTTVGIFNLRHSDRERSENSGPGLPNYLGSMAVHPAGDTVFVPSKQDNILGGAIRTNGVLTFDQTVRAISSELVLDGAQSRERLAGRIEHDNASVATAAVYGPYGIHLFTALEGNRQVAVSLPENNAEVVRIDVGLAPQGLALSPDGRTLAVHNFMSRSVQFLDIADIVDFGGLTSASLADVATVASESLGAEVFYGKQLFYDAKDDRLAALDYMSCASCHADGGDDGRVWDFSQFGEGLRNTITLRGRSGTGHGFLHWTANFDETQDFEGQIRDFAGGSGLMSDNDFFSGSRSEPLGDPKTGLSGDLDALAAYTASLTRGEQSPYRSVDGALTADAELGRQVFNDAGCAQCHTAPRYTDSALVNLHDVGTLSPTSGGRLGGTLTGIDTPSLISAWQTPPYLHDGSAASLAQAVTAHSGVNLGTADANRLSAYLAQLDEVTALITDESVVYQAGNLTFLQPDSTTWLRVTFDVPFDAAPIVTMGALSYNGGDPTVLRVRNVSADGFDYQMDEWDYRDGWHTTETVSWLAMRPGRHDLGGLVVEAGSIAADSAKRNYTYAQPFASTPLLFSQTVTTNEASAVTTRHANLSPTGFRLEIEEEEASSDGHISETVHYMAIESGTGTLADGGSVAAGATGNTVTHDWSSLSFGGTYHDTIFFAAMQTTDGGDTANVRYRNLSATDVQIQVDEEQSANSEVSHTTEVVGWLRLTLP